MSQFAKNTTAEKLAKLFNIIYFRYKNQLQTYFTTAVKISPDQVKPNGKLHAVHATNSALIKNLKMLECRLDVIGKKLVKLPLHSSGPNAAPTFEFVNYVTLTSSLHQLSSSPHWKGLFNHKYTNSSARSPMQDEAELNVSGSVQGQCG